MRCVVPVQVLVVVIAIYLELLFVEGVESECDACEIHDLIVVAVTSVLITVVTWLTVDVVHIIIIIAITVIITTIITVVVIIVTISYELRRDNFVQSTRIAHAHETVYEQCNCERKSK